MKSAFRLGSGCRARELLVLPEEQSAASAPSTPKAIGMRFTMADDLAWHCRARISQLGEFVRSICPLWPRKRLRRINCDAPSIHQIPFTRVGRRGAKRTTDCALAGIDVLEEVRGHGRDLERLWRVRIHVHDRFFPQHPRLLRFLAWRRAVARTWNTR